MSTNLIDKTEKIGSKKTKKELLLELLQLESENVGSLGNESVTEPEKVEIKPAPLTSQEINDDEPVVAPKKKLTEKQLEALKKGQQKRDENARKRLEEKKKKEEEEKKIMEEKLIKKAIAIKKKQIKKQQMLDELSDDEGIDAPHQLVGGAQQKPKVSPSTPSSIVAPKKDIIPSQPLTPPPPYVFTFF